MYEERVHHGNIGKCGKYFESKNVSVCSVMTHH